MSSAPVVWFGALREPSGYADEARTYLLALENEGYQAVGREPGWVRDIAGMPAHHRAVVDLALRRPIPEQYVAVQHVVPHPSQSNAIGVPNVLRTMFETDGLPSVFKSRLMDVDEIWVPAEFNVETFARGGIPAGRLKVLPETIDFALFDPAVTDPWPIEGARGFTFLTNFDFTDRKGWDILLDAWALAFEPDDDVSLVLKVVSLHGASADGIRLRIEQHLAGRETAPIVLLAELLPSAEIPRLYAAADAYVMASHGEGWGRPYMEAMAMGIPTIGSRWSGNLEFMNDGNSWLVDGSLADIPEAAQVHTSLYGGQRWFDPDVEALAAAMREVRAGGADVEQRAASARTGLTENFGPEPVVAKLVELAAGLYDRWRSRSTTAVTCAWRGDFGAGHSLAVVNDGIVDGLERAGEAVRRLAPESVATRVDTVGIASQWPPSFAAPAHGPFVLYQPWEFGTVPESWAESIRMNVDEVWAPSEYVRRAYIDSGVAEELVHVVPNGVDLERFTPDGPAWELPDARGTVFLFVGGTIARKGIDILLQAYAREFSADDDVTLVLKGFGAGSFYRGQTNERMIEIFEAIPDRPDVVFLDEEVPFDRLPSLYRAASAVVQPYRGEGFCLPALEALACGVPVIVTNGGPTDDFTSDECSWRLPSLRVPVDPGAFAEQELTLVPGAYVLEPDVDALARALRAAADPAQRAPKAAAARRHAEPFGWDACAARAAARIQALSGRVPVRTMKPAAVPDRRGFLFHVPAEWRSPDTWAPALHAYLEAFSAADDVTLVFPAADVEGATALVGAELERSGVDATDVADIALADPGDLGLVSLELAADAVICPDRSAAPRARVVVPPTADALRAATPIAKEAA
ncbi:MAG TPA: glycosyltransferase family 4 protein [Gaiellaceae bacterium]|jgi:glycosyltransferase involved in cell wall biosynthesis|nr:glycosyltransferase family 4 protein [Gaiellaceae bacterium]